MTVPNGPVVLIVDALPLRSLGFVSTLNRLNRLGDPTAVLRTPNEGSMIDAHADCEMLIYVAGGACKADYDNLERIKALRVLAPDVPLMILSDSESREEIISTLNVGEQEFLYVGAKAELALKALSFVLNGESNFPSAMRPEHTYPARRDPAIDSTVPSCVMNEDNRSLTARQKAVLELLSRGETNKLIARRLGMTEGTVKVHVRHIMRKFGATNRTQVAVVCTNGH